MINKNYKISEEDLNSKNKVNLTNYIGIIQEINDIDEYISNEYLNENIREDSFNVNDVNKDHNDTENQVMKLIKINWSKIFQIIKLKQLK